MRIAAALPVLFLLLCASARAAAAPVLGSPDFMPQYGVGWGKVAPRKIHNGGDPSGLVSNIRWTGWGRTVAHARGTGNIFRLMGGYFPPVRVTLRVRDLGTCPGHPRRAYTTLEVRYPQWPGGPLGEWVKWAGSVNMCGVNTHDPAYRGLKVPGDCTSVGGDLRPGAVTSIRTYKIPCGSARSVAARVRRWARPPDCDQHGCQSRIRGTNCRLDRVHTHDDAGIHHRHKTQRLVCRAGGRSLSAYLVLNEAA
jgi:hypothetical protein